MKKNKSKINKENINLALYNNPIIEKVESNIYKTALRDKYQPKKEEDEKKENNENKEEEKKLENNDNNKNKFTFK